MKPRAAVILIENDRIALIERYRSATHYFAFPGGKVEAGETSAIAAKREILEELGLDVEIGQMVGEVWYMGTPQYYFLAQIVGGQFGAGAGKEMSDLPDSPKGSHLPTWMKLEEITKQPVLPKPVAEYVYYSSKHGWPSQPLVIKDQSNEDVP
jgi:8-oxo-dGTP diphosphatase